ncbi:hypothetical protein CVT24_007173, partial [Panaeolus cyanescens]
APVIRNKAPIWKTNHINVNIIHPPPEHEIGTTRSTFDVDEFPLSRIPHLLLGNLNAKRAADILVFFPRAMHQDPTTGYWANTVPKDVQDLFWDHVLNPALIQTTKPTRMPYTHSDRQHLRFKQGRGRSHLPGNHVVPGSQLTEMFQVMNNILNNDHVGLAAFRSFFIVVQIKGCKHDTHEESEDISEALRLAIANLESAFPALDWSYMKDRSNGEVYYDAGLTIQPVLEPDEQPLVGLWRLDSLEATYGAAGFLSGDLHTINTFSLYGGMQAEAPKERAKRTHLAFQSTYNLAYEAVRQKDNSRDLFKESSVYERDVRFQQEVSSVCNVMKEVRDRSYGVRWESRVGVLALDVLIESLHDRVTLILLHHIALH